jgi:aspartyl-tRNA(Asn)/glutamyl-tRNA(Gln) amidotransferase subunit A|tara:strand:- start:137 stop:1636 length:1500 start_codon:yes stop_codon:yes gene_type:complete
VIFPGIRDIAAALDRGDYSVRELTEQCLSDARTANERLNCLITIADERALAQADAIDRARARGDTGTLAGVPLVHKDIYCTEGLPTTCASRMLANFTAPYSATVVERLDAAGMVTFAKANLDEFAMGSSNENSHFGAVANPWDTDRVPGGSSGGSAASVAAGLTPVATGTDTGGSIRQPASFCGISGIKPTYGRVSRYGMIAFASSLDQGGVLARDVEDLALVLGAMAGYDERDSTSSSHDDAWLEGVSHTGVGMPDRSLTIGLPLEYFEHHTGSVALVDAAKATLEAAGARFVDVSLPNTAAAIPAYYIIAGAEASTNLSRYDGVRFGYRCENTDSIEELYERSRSEAFGAEVKRRILTGTYALSVGYYDAYYLKAQKIRRLIQNDFLRAFESVDLLLTPTTPGVAFRRGELTGDPVAMYQQDVYTTPASLAGLPAMSLPCGMHERLPVGMQLIGPHFAERALLQAGALYQRETDWHSLTPDIGEHPSADSPVQKEES